MPSKVIGFIGPSYQLESRPSSVQRTINLIPVPEEPGNERTGWVFRDLPGLEDFSSSVDVIDPYWDSVIWLLHGDGILNPAVYLDEKGGTWTRGGGAASSTRVIAPGEPFGDGSISFDNDAGIQPLITKPLAATVLAAGNKHTIEGVLTYFPGYQPQTAAGCIRTTANPTGTGMSAVYMFNFGGTIRYQTTMNGVTNNLDYSPGAPVVKTRYPVAATFDGTTKRLYVNYVLVNSVAVAAGAAQTLATGFIGNLTGVFGDASRVDEARATINVARYTGASYTPQSAPFPNS